MDETEDDSEPPPEDITTQLETLSSPIEDYLSQASAKVEVRHGNGHDTYRIVRFSSDGANAGQVRTSHRPNNKHPYSGEAKIAPLNKSGSIILEERVMYMLIQGSKKYWRRIDTNWDVDPPGTLT